MYFCMKIQIKQNKSIILLRRSSVISPLQHFVNLAPFQRVVGVIARIHVVLVQDLAASRVVFNEQGAHLRAVAFHCLKRKVTSFNCSSTTIVILYLIEATNTSVLKHLYNIESAFLIQAILRVFCLRIEIIAHIAMTHVLNNTSMTDTLGKCATVYLNDWIAELTPTRTRFSHNSSGRLFYSGL